MGQQVHFPNLLRPETLPKRLQTRQLQAIGGQVPVRETIIRWYRHRGMDLAEEYMWCHCGKELETYEHFMQCEQSREIDRPLVKGQDILLLKRGAKGRREVGTELEKEGHHMGLRRMVIMKSLWWGLREHTVARDVIAYRLVRRTVEHLQERMTCRGALLKARAEDMRDPVTKTIVMRPRWGGLARGRCGEHASKQAGKALRSQGHHHRTKRSRILATLKQNKSMYQKNTSGYVHQWVKPWTGVRVPYGNRHSVPNHITSLGPTFSVACRYWGSNTTDGPAETGP